MAMRRTLSVMVLSVMVLAVSLVLLLAEASPSLAQVRETRLLFPFVTSQVGFDTGIAIANTTADPFGSFHATAGACTLHFFGANAPAAITTPAIAAGTTYSTVGSLVAPNFQGYVIAVCDFPLAHGFAFVSDLGARTLATSYLALVMKPSFVRVAPEGLDQ